MYYVTMTDKFMSDWGMAQGKINKLVFECETLEDVEKVQKKAERREEMKYVNFCIRKPYYNSNTHYVQFKDKEDYPQWYK